MENELETITVGELHAFLSLVLLYEGVTGNEKVFIYADVPLSVYRKKTILRAYSINDEIHLQI